MKNPSLINAISIQYSVFVDSPIHRFFSKSSKTPNYLCKICVLADFFVDHI